MTQARLIADLSEYVVWYAFVVTVLFPVVTSAFWPWWKSAWGWNIVTLEMGIALALLAPWLRFAFGIRIVSSYVAGWSEITAIGICGGVVTWRAVIIYLTQRAAVREQELASEESPAPGGAGDSQPDGGPA
jgi:hypothetical protein